MACLVLMTLPSATARATQAELCWFVGAARPPTVRTIRQFAEEEIVIPEGKYQDRKWRAYRQPYAALLFDLMGHGPWTRRAILGPVQSGKTLNGVDIPLLHSLFELGDTTIFGLPTMDLASTKWTTEIQPLIRRTRYANLLPTKGAGSRGGTKLESVTFANGARLEFMSGHANDEKRSGFTARRAYVTEIDKMDRPGQVSREADPLVQIEARTDSFDIGEAEINLECTVSITEGRIWQEYIHGTATRIIHQCPHAACGKWISPEREHLFGWQQAQNKLQAAREAFFCCPQCGGRLTDAQRYQMNQGARAIHRGQEIAPDGRIVGEPAETDTLGFRWSAFQNMFASTAKLGAKEWAAAHTEDEENAKKEMCQFVWAVPYEPPLWDETPLSAAVVKRRMASETKGLVPADAKYFTVGVDVHKRFGVWIAIAWREDGSGHVVDYGTFEICADDLGVEKAILIALREFKENIIQPGWQTRAGEPRVPEQVWIDARYQPQAIYQFIREQRDRRFRPSLGCGSGDQYPRRYRKPRKTGAEVKLIGQDFHLVWFPKDRVFVVQVNADQWKSNLHERLATPEGQPGALVFFHSTNPNEHTTLSKQLSESEKIQEEFKPGKGLVRRWIRKSRGNHYFDAAYNACAAGHLLGSRIVGQPQAARTSAPRSKPTPVRTPDGRAFLATER